MKSFTTTLALLATITGTFSSEICDADANVCLGPNGSDLCLPRPMIKNNCYDLPADWVGNVTTLTPLQDDIVCTAQIAPCTEMMNNVCHDTLDCTGYMILSKENPTGWDLETYAPEWRAAILSFTCYANETMPRLPFRIANTTLPQ